MAVMENFSNYEYEYDYEDGSLFAANIPNIVTYSVVLYIGLCTNIWMVWSLYKTWQTDSRSHFYLLALCIADVVGLCIKCPVTIGTAATIFWKGGDLGCKILMPLSYFGPMVVHFILAGFNVDNLVTVVNKRSIKSIRIAFLICAIALAVLICVPLMFLYRQESMGYQDSATYCILSYDVLPMWIIPQVQLVALYWLPAIFMIFCGGPALCVWYGRKDEIPFQKKMHEDGQNSEMKTVGKDIGMVVAYDILFLLCWTPLTVFTFVYPSLGYHVILAKTVYALPIVNSCIDPFIYAVFTCINKRRVRASPEL